MRKNELDKINDKMGLIEETLKDEVPKISMPILRSKGRKTRKREKSTYESHCVLGNCYIGDCMRIFVVS